MGWDALVGGVLAGVVAAGLWALGIEALRRHRFRQMFGPLAGRYRVTRKLAPKSEKGVRKVPMPSVLRAILLEHIARTGRRGEDLMFGSTASTPFTPTNIRKRALGAWAASAVGAFLRHEPSNLEPIGLHECRHTYVSLMHAAGCSLEEIGDYVGHSSTYMTDRYRHLLDGQREAAVAKFDAYLAQVVTG